MAYIDGSFSQQSCFSSASVTRTRARAARALARIGVASRRGDLEQSLFIIDFNTTCMSASQYCVHVV